ncbi:MAG TPA: T9SS type A sorting domain-containing protein [Ignavibacteriaceae bacterium]|nr:T9SS type A sorting domain-containing protein [Ignavibacteriaceae bacterium]
MAFTFNKIFAGTTSGLYFKTYEDSVFTRIANMPGPNDMILDSSNRIIIATNSGIYRSKESINVVSVENEMYLPQSFSLEQNYPNPFNPNTTIKFNLPEQNYVTIKVFDVLGREIKTLMNEEKSSGTYEINFSVEDLTSGVYFYRIDAGKYSETKKMLLMK